jgi:PAS domain S-box-containing protein
MQIERRDEPTETLDAPFREWLERIPGTVYVQRGSGTASTIYMSPRVEELVGRPAATFTSDPNAWSTLVHPDDRARLDAADRQADLDGVFHCDYRLRTADGSYRWFRDEACLQTDLDEDLWVGVLVDVTAERERERELTDALTKFQTLAERLPAVVYIESRDGSATSPSYLSPRYEEVFGYTVQERLSDPDLWATILHPDDRKATLDAAQRSADSGEPFAMDYRITRKDGSLAWIHDETVLILGDDGETLFWQGILTDITERKRTEEELRAAVRRFQTLAEQIPAVTYIEPLGGPVSPLYVSPQYEAMFGYTPEERLSDPGLWERLLHPDDRERVLAQVQAIGDDADGWFLEYRMIHRDGRIVWVHDQAVTVRDDVGAPLFYQGVLFDVTDTKRAQEELRRALDELRKADEMKNTFLTAVSHDLRTPLATILGNAITLEHGDELGLTDEERRTMLRSLSAKARRLTELITDLLDMDRLARGALEPRFTPEELSEIVERIAEEVDIVGDRQVELDVRPTVTVLDRSMVERIVENLIVNAARHTPPEATIWVRVRPVGDGAEIIVEDNGPGVPAELRDALFQPFERGPSANQHSPGVGLGLSLVARFAELHAGRAWVEERSGGGAAFHVLLAVGDRIS